MKSSIFALMLLSPTLALDLQPYQVPFVDTNLTVPSTPEEALQANVTLFFPFFDPNSLMNTTCYASHNELGIRIGQGFTGGCENDSVTFDVKVRASLQTSFRICCMRSSPFKTRLASWLHTLSRYSMHLLNHSPEWTLLSNFALETVSRSLAFASGYEK